MELPERIWAHKYPNGVVGAHDRPGRNPYYTSAEYVEYIRADLAILIPPEGQERDVLVDQLVAAAEQYFDRDPDIHHAVVVERMVIAALKALIGEKG